jgi:formylglycine-generating enzyme required for sulfatase activity
MDRIIDAGIKGVILVVVIYLIIFVFRLIKSSFDVATKKIASRMDNTENSTSKIFYQNEVGPSSANIYASPEIAKINTKAIQNTVSSQIDEELFAIALQELNSGNSVQGLWAKCFAEADGDENKTKARYLSARAGQLGAENAAIQFEVERVARMRSLKAEVEPEMVTLPKGQFVMGSGNGNEKPQHTVQIEYVLAVGKYPITFDQWDACLKDGGTTHKPDDEGWGRGSRPVINVSWDDIQLYLSWLRKITGNTYRLLSEAEWEYAARAGSQTTYSFGDDEKELGRYAWFDENSGSKTHPVGEKLPNAFGLHDMLGNVWERTEDNWNENYNGAPTDGSAWTAGIRSPRVLRGGSWDNSPPNLRAANRVRSSIYFRVKHLVGFRVARTD